MTIRKIIYLPDPRLRKICEPVTDILSEEIQTLIDDMFETMYAAHGAGLAANQIGICLRLAVMNVARKNETEKEYCLINPEIIEAHGFEEMDEGCLSVPGCYGKVKRPTYVKARALDRNGQPYEIEGDGVLAECIHHEIDHLNGKLYIDQLSALKRELIKKKLQKHLRERGEM